MRPQKQMNYPRNEETPSPRHPHVAPVSGSKGEEDISKAGIMARMVIRSNHWRECHKYSRIANCFHIPSCAQCLQGVYHNPKFSHVFISFLSVFPTGLQGHESLVYFAQQCNLTSENDAQHIISSTQKASEQ